MIVRCFAAAALAMFAVAPSGAAQSTQELLQKGIYTQETVGDLDGAIKIYRQIVDSAAANRACAADAHYRLAQCLLRKNLSVAAAMAFQKLVEHYPEQKDLVAKARESLRELAPYLPLQYYDAKIGLSFSAPAGWSIGRSSYSQEGELSVHLIDPQKQSFDVLVWARKHETPAGEVSRRMFNNMPWKVQSRQEAGYEGYRYRPEATVMRQVGGHYVLRCVTDYSKEGQNLVEYITWVDSATTNVILRAELVPENLEEFRARFDQIIDTVEIP